ncbi:secretoglobin family 2A member 2-like [Arvicanthis niloticus]|uniref:secretoglobin family 2A member 2-like n=1 Tax=Arvicanthis niloticus TaxID=61156 RepID=UPI0014861351|nr:secretoglobin family 2A member 2-like [Arvicanthis niloticus]
MKLVVLFMLVTIPICCYASGSGCSILDNIIKSTINSSVSAKDYLELVGFDQHGPYVKKAIKDFKQCFLDQSEETLANFQVMMDAIYNSYGCQQSS